MLSLRHRRQTESEHVYQMGRANALLRSTYDYRSHGGNAHEGTQEDFVVEGRRIKRLTPYDKFLKAFQYGNALDAVLTGVSNKLKKRVYQTNISNNNNY
jgi:U3 small nucleolar RNA-associated protein 15